MLTNFFDFMANIIVESLHPDIQKIVADAPNKWKASKQSQIAKAIKEISARGEKTGIEGNMPKGSSRAYMQHDTPLDATVDGKKVFMKTGTKVAIKSNLDAHHNGEDSLGSMQNIAENGDHWVNKSYRTLTKNDNGHYESNHEGIFPPLHSQDEEHHEWAHVGHARSIKKSEFKELSKSDSHPQGIKHEDFVRTLNRFHDRNNGRHYDAGETNERAMDKIEEHPLVQHFQDYHGNTGNPTHDYAQIGNLGAWKHPVTGKEHIVARDHGFSTEVAQAYKDANRMKYSPKNRL